MCTPCSSRTGSSRGSTARAGAGLSIAPDRCRARSGIAAYMDGSGWHGVARASGQAHISVGGIEQTVAVQDADQSVLVEVAAAYDHKYGSRYANIVNKINDAEHRASTLRLVPPEAS